MVPVSLAFSDQGRECRTAPPSLRGESAVGEPSEQAIEARIEECKQGISLDKRCLDACEAAEVALCAAEVGCWRLLRSELDTLSWQDQMLPRR